MIGPFDYTEPKQSRAVAFNSNWMQAAKLAALNGLEFKRCSDVHYQLSHRVDKWLVNIYPTKCRLYKDRKRPCGPFITGFDFYKPGGLTALEFMQAVMTSCGIAQPVEELSDERSMRPAKNIVT